VSGRADERPTDVEVCGAPRTWMETQESQVRHRLHRSYGAEARCMHATRRWCGRHRESSLLLFRSYARSSMRTRDTAGRFARPARFGHGVEWVRSATPQARTLPSALCQMVKDCSLDNSWSPRQTTRDALCPYPARSPGRATGARRADACTSAVAPAGAVHTAPQTGTSCYDDAS
jgi:hypothetical protein